MSSFAIQYRGVLALIAACTLLLLAVPAHAVKDLLQIPARKSDLAAHSLLLSVTLAGNRLVAVGERGIVVYSDNDGESWAQAAVPVSVTLTAVSFPTPTVGWAVGHDGVILRSTDGGMSWTKQFDGNDANALVLAEIGARVKALRDTMASASGKTGEAAAAGLSVAEHLLEDVKAGAEFGPSRPLLGLWFRNESEGYVVGSFGQLFHTVDGGKHWQSLGSLIANPESLHYNVIIAASDGRLLIAGEGGKLYQTRDGATWDALDTGYQGHLYGCIAIPDTKILVVYGFAGTVFRSSDDGKTWQSVPKVTNKSIVGGMLLSDGRLLLIDRDRRQLTSHDQGVSFRVSTTPQSSAVAGVAPLLVKKKIVLAGVGGVSLLPVDSGGR